MEGPRLGVESELWLLAYTTATATQDLSLLCDLHHSLGSNLGEMAEGFLAPDACSPSHTLWFPGAGDSRSRASGIWAGCLCRGRRTSSREPATKVLPAFKTPSSLRFGLKVPLSSAGGLLTGSPPPSPTPCPALTFLGLFSLPLFSSHSLGCPGVALAPWERKTKLLKGRVVCFLHCFDVGTLPAFIKPSQAQSHRPPGGGWAGAKL